MEASVNFAEAVACDVRVNFRRADILVPKQFLDDAQVCAVLQQMGGKTVAQHVRCDVSANPRVQRPFFDSQPKSHR